MSVGDAKTIVDSKILTGGARCLETSIDNTLSDNAT